MLGRKSREIKQLKAELARVIQLREAEISKLEQTVLGLQEALSKSGPHYTQLIHELRAKLEAVQQLVG